MNMSKENESDTIWSLFEEITFIRGFSEHIGSISFQEPSSETAKSCCQTVTQASERLETTLSDGGSLIRDALFGGIRTQVSSRRSRVGGVRSCACRQSTAVSSHQRSAL